MHAAFAFSLRNFKNVIKEKRGFVGREHYPIKEVIIVAKKCYRPGEKAPQSGQYKNTSTGYEVTVVKGEPLPPTPKSGQCYILVDKTKHKSNK